MSVLQNVLHISMAVAYTGILIFIFTRINRKQGMILSWKWIAAAFLAKAAAGMIYGYIYSHYYTVSDSWSYFNESLGDYHDLIHNPARFFSINSGFNHFTDFFSTADNAFWSNAGENILIKLLAILNVFSNGNYYIDVILFNAFSFWGLYLIYRVAIYHIPGKNVWIYLLLFFWPSALFWNSAIDKDGLMIFLSGILIYSVHQGILRNKTTLFSLMAVASFAGIVLIRNVNAFIFIPAIIAWWISAKMDKRHLMVFLSVYCVAFILFAASGLAGSSFNLPQKLADKQHQFLSLEANTRLPLTPLEPNFGSYLKVFPEAVNHVFFRPYIIEISSSFHLIAFLENTALVLILCYILIWNKKKEVSYLTNPFNMFLWSVSLTGLLLIGYTVPFPGGIIRYKAFYTMLFLLPFFSCINWHPSISNSNKN